MIRLLVAISLLFASVSGFALSTGPPDEQLKRRLVLALSAQSEGFDQFDAEVWLTDYSSRLTKFRKNPYDRYQLLRQIYFEAARVELPPEMVLSVIEVESHFDRFAISRSGARGLMQIMPFWLQEIGRPDDNLFISDTNLRFGCTILRYYYDMENGDWVKALARYNGSRGSTRYPNKVFKALRQHWAER